VIYAEKIRAVMLKAMPHLEDSSSGFRDVKEYETLVRGNKKDK
jgi:hypothetical protein